MSSLPQKSPETAKKSSSEELSKEDVKTCRDSPPESDADDSSSEDDEIETEVSEDEIVENGMLDSLIHRLMTAKSSETPMLQLKQNNNSEGDTPKK